MSNYMIAAQTLGIASAFTAAGGIASLSVFDVPILRALPASRSLPQIRWLFSRGSHTYPTAALLSTATFAYLAYAVLPTSPESMVEGVKMIASGGKSTAYLSAALLCGSIGPWTTFIMLPTNLKLINSNTKKGGYWSSESAEVAEKKGSAATSDAVEGDHNTGEFMDVSRPQSKTKQDSTPAEDREVHELLSKFGQLNAVRGVLMAVGGTVALLAGLNP